VRRWLTHTSSQRPECGRLGLARLFHEPMHEAAIRFFRAAINGRIPPPACANGAAAAASDGLSWMAFLGALRQNWQLVIQKMLAERIKVPSTRGIGQQNGADTAAGRVTNKRGVASRSTIFPDDLAVRVG
jgi:hypothetical protein